MKCVFCNEEHKVTVPTIHNNGTSPENLLSECQEAIEALSAAHHALIKTAPNGRDYYLTPGAMAIAEDAHRVRIRTVLSTMEELQEIRDHIQTVIDFRSAHRR